MAKEKAEQIVMQGVVSEIDIYRAIAGEYGRKGGKMKTARQQAARRANMERLNARRAARIAARKGGEG